MTDRELEKLLQNFAKKIVNDGEALGIAIALTKPDAKNVMCSCYGSPFEMGYMLSKAVESIMNTFETQEDIDSFVRGLIETIQYLNRMNRNKNKHLH